MRRFLSILRPPVQQHASKVLSENEIRLLNREQLVKYALELSQNSSSPSARADVDEDAQRKTGAQSDSTLPKSPADRNANNGNADAPIRKKRKRRAREFDWTKYGVRPIALRLSYLGWNYHGFASQPHSQNTVEHHLFAALQKTYLVRSRVECGYSRAGRTDVGVSARTQVVGITVRSNVMEPSTGKSEFEYARMLNAVLPDEIRVTGWFPVAGQKTIDNGNEMETSIGKKFQCHPGDPPEIIRAVQSVNDSATADTSDVRRPGAEFSARFDASWRAYKYHFIPDGLDIGAMKAGCANFVGRHTFINFCKIDENVQNFERLMYDVDVIHSSSNNKKGCYIYVRGQAFLWHQVRCMVAILFEIGRGRESPDIVTKMLEQQHPFDQGKPAYRMASPIPLVLDECYYPKSILQFPTSVAGADSDGVNAKLFAEHALKASVIRGFMDDSDSQQQKNSNNYILDSKSNRMKYTRLENRTMEKRKTYLSTSINKE